MDDLSYPGILPAQPNDASRRTLEVAEAIFSRNFDGDIKRLSVIKQKAITPMACFTPKQQNGLPGRQVKVMKLALVDQPYIC
jgi:hypothetical protein